MSGLAGKFTSESVQADNFSRGLIQRSFRICSLLLESYPEESRGSVLLPVSERGILDNNTNPGFLLLFCLSVWGWDSQTGAPFSPAHTRFLPCCQGQVGL